MSKTPNTSSVTRVSSVTNLIGFVQLIPQPQRARTHRSQAQALWKSAAVCYQERDSEVWRGNPRNHIRV